ncbi:hypothetical protein HII31_09437 [Pseudocercospora fuligena]|uniref:F-box domain-containing protein n=1 Tax=Pseudocercospora fuligena TaxID=685502 RepID=A0A8H6VII1_9PEZI|nr:hypothetical protein HII31_09437 [Pseudocercospora fuligena]
MAPDPSAASRVFGITELHEKILIHLSPLDLLHSQRVGRTWLDNIRGSTVIQRIIYPEPVTPEFAWIFKLARKTLDKHLFGECIKDVVSMAEMKSRYSKNARAHSATFNELLLCREYGHGHKTASDRGWQGEVLKLTQQANKALFVHNAPLSCDNMPLVNIALYEMEVKLECGCRGPRSSTDCLNNFSFGRVRNPNGLRVKDLRNFVRKVCPRSRVGALKFPATDPYYPYFRKNSADTSRNGILFPTEAEAHWVKQNRKLVVKWSH